MAAGLQSCLAYLESFAFTDEDLDWLAQPRLRRRRGRRVPPPAVHAATCGPFPRDGSCTPTSRSWRSLRRSPRRSWSRPTSSTRSPTRPRWPPRRPAAVSPPPTDSSSSTSRCDAPMAWKPGWPPPGCPRWSGSSATSNVAAACRYGLRPAGTMAHSYVEAFPSETDAFRTFAEDFPGRTTFLVDTYDTVEGVARGDRGDPRARSSRQRWRAARQWRSDRRRPGRPASSSTTPVCITCASSSAAASTNTTCNDSRHLEPRSTPPGSAPRWGCR